MQNPFRHRPSDDFARRDADDTRWEARDQRYDEGRSWSEGDGGRTYQAYGDQSRSTGRAERSRDWDYGRQADYGRDRARASSSYDQYGYGSQPDYGRNAAYDQDRYSGGYQSNRDPGRDYGRNDYTRGDYGRSQDYAAHGYAPGAEIWRDQGQNRSRSAHSRHDFEPDYLHWRDQQVSNFDRDYDDWRSERRQKFSSDFDTWRQNRSANPIVGDVADGGTGDAREAKKS